MSLPRFELGSAGPKPDILSIELQAHYKRDKEWLFKYIVKVDLKYLNFKHLNEKYLNVYLFSY